MQACGYWAHKGYLRAALAMPANKRRRVTSHSLPGL
jgi:hypothetical protein